MWPFFEQALARYRELEQQLADPETAADRAAFTRLAREHGALVNPIGDDVIRIAPALTMTAAEADETVRRIGAALAAAPALS